MTRPIFMNRILFFFLLLLSSYAALWAQERISVPGVVQGASEGEPIFGAIIRVEGTDIAIKSDFDGIFTLSGIKPGKYFLNSEATFYANFRREFDLSEGDTIKIVMQPGVTGLDAVVVKAQANKSSETSLLVAARKAVLSTQSIGTKELSRKGLGDAEVAVTQISGISKQEGVKNIFVRGLGDRYNATSLNGFPLPSDDAEYKNIALSLFPSDVIQNVSVAKVMGARLYGDVGGAGIDISSRELEGSRAFSASASIGLNPLAVGSPFYVQDGSSYLGFNTSSMPASVDEGYNFSQNLHPHQQKMPLNHDYALSGGKKFYLGEIPLKFYIIADYEKKYSKTNELIRETVDDGSVFGDMNGIKHQVETHQLVFGNLNTYTGDSHLAYNLLFIHNNGEYVGNYEGFNADKYQGGFEESGRGAYIRQQTNENLLLTQQLYGHKSLGESWRIDGGFSYSWLKGKEPDRRLNRFLFIEKPDYYTILGGEGSQQRFFSELLQHDLSGKIEGTYKFDKRFEGDDSQIIVGYRFRYNKDRYHSDRFSFVRYRGSDVFTLDELNLDEIYNSDSYSQGAFEMAQFNDFYTANKWLHAGFVDATYSFLPELTVNLGLRLDYVDQHLAYEVNQLSPGQNNVKKLFLLPFLSLRSNLGDHVLRLGLSKTYTLPHTKETAPYEYVGNSFTSVGNAHLLPSDNYNFDLRWEYYFSRGEMISVTGFYKLIRKPILRIYEGNAAGYLTYKNLTEGEKDGKARVAGVEIELKKELLDLYKHSLRVGLSGSYIYSHLFLTGVGNKEDRHTRLEGASPWIVNADLTYRYDISSKYDIQATVIFNYFSDRIFTIGTQGFENTIEHGVPTLNAVISSKLDDFWTVTLKANNLFNPDQTLSRKNNAGTEVVFLNRINKGQQLSIGVSYSF